MAASEDGGGNIANGNGSSSPYPPGQSGIHEYPPPAGGLSFRQRMRTRRHDPCLMRPVAALMISAVCLLGLVGLALQLPTFLLGLAMAPLLRRGSFLVEFLYPLSVARWGHLVLMRWGLRSRVGTGSGGAAAAPGTDESGRPRKAPPPQHSRSIEQRTEVVRGRVYVHPLPQLLDNVGYLILCLPPPAAAAAASGGDDDGNDDDSPALGILVDVGDAASALAQCETVFDAHYAHLLRPKPSNNNKANKKSKKRKGGGGERRRLEIRSVLCTHKHHDHTAGNRSLLRDRHDLTRNLSGIHGGAAERVPHCDRPVRNGERVALPRAGRNDMAEVCEIECVAVPSHTRGSVVYALRPRASSSFSSSSLAEENGGAGSLDIDDDVASTTTHLFTGDAMFSGGGGVAFEADVEFPSDKAAAKKGAGSPIRAAAGRNSIERCFAEVLVRCRGTAATSFSGGGDGNGNGNGGGGFPARAMIYPGHEYTSELLVRQFDASNEFHGQWSRLPPSVFFRTAAHYLVSSHRRTLPKHGRILTVPTSLGRELVVNPHFRSLRKRGEHLVTALGVWYKHCARGKLPPPVSDPFPLDRSGRSRASTNGGGSYPRTASDVSLKTPSTPHTWTMDHDSISRPVFSTVYASDLDSVVADLRSGAVSPRDAARRLEAMSRRLDEPVVRRRPIPGTVPGDRNAYLGVLALLVLGSPPCGMTPGDAEAMGLPYPPDSSDEIRISRRRLLTTLELLGLVEGAAPSGGSGRNGDSPGLVQIIDLLWEEAAGGCDGGDGDGDKAGDDLHLQEEALAKGASGDRDELELGLLKLALYGAEMNQPSWFGRLCRPCGGRGGGRGRGRKGSSVPPSKGGGDGGGTPRKSNGELVRHDASTCPMCVDAVGCPAADGAEERRWDGLVSDEENDSVGGGGGSNVEEEEESSATDEDDGDTEFATADEAYLGTYSFARTESGVTAGGGEAHEGGIELNIVPLVL